MPKDSFPSFIEKYGKRRLAIVTHREADLDAVASAFAMSSILPQSEILLFDNPDDQVDLLIEKLGIRYRKISDISNKAEFYGAVIVDSANTALVKGMDGWKPLCIIDHHRRAGKDIEAEFEIIDEDSPSASEVIATILLSSPHHRLPKSVAFALAVGIIADTAQFNSGRLQTFELLAKLMKLAGATYRELLFYSDPPKSLDKKIAIAKALKKMDYTEYKGHIIVTCKSGSSEGDAATVLASKLDAAFVAKKDTKNKGYTRISARANKNADLKLNEVMMKVGERLNGRGGGHFKAAGARVQAKPDEALAACVEALKQWIDSDSKD